jgi:hypothetical protein
MISLSLSLSLSRSLSLSLSLSAVGVFGCGCYDTAKLLKHLTNLFFFLSLPPPFSPPLSDPPAVL